MTSSSGALTEDLIVMKQSQFADVGDMTDRPPERLRQADVENSSPMRTGVTQAYENLCTVLHFSQRSVFHKLLTTKRPFDFKNSVIHKRAISFLFQL